MSIPVVDSSGNLVRRLSVSSYLRGVKKSGAVQYHQRESGKLKTVESTLQLWPQQGVQKTAQNHEKLRNNNNNNDKSAVGSIAMDKRIKSQSIPFFNTTLKRPTLFAGRIGTTHNLPKDKDAPAATASTTLLRALSPERVHRYPDQSPTPFFPHAHPQGMGEELLITRIDGSDGTSQSSGLGLCLIRREARFSENAG
ncbi:hypothetical protein BDP55DRAFT_626024 [Colletotrichum godetiae]|uniref:Uncharacterized protein n=1 Tax=Colletotrichum godetiae TaxID=1209918 RepID=A0AAJ0AY47_9PEZI|nr:uncharacterized protein BDP55DRAFT_626024 [Colletotrichum godetiae]KAK1700446.1 hypothetical protein BDP55DRAFT_626024 [Colletotrichum godetiae]